MALALVACGGTDISVESPSTGSRESTAAEAPNGPTSYDSWAPFGISGSEVESFRALADMKRGSDLVVVGRLASSSDDTRIVQGDAAEDVVHYANATLQVDDVLAASTDQMELIVEFLGEAPVPESRVLIFLRLKRGEGEGGLYRAVNSAGLFAETSRSKVDTPLAEAPPAENGPFSSEIREQGISSLDTLIAYIRRIG